MEVMFSIFQQILLLTAWCVTTPPKLYLYYLIIPKDEDKNKHTWA